MSDKSKKEGRNLAYALIDKITAITEKNQEQVEPPIIETSPLVEAIEALSNNPVDLSPLVEAIAALEHTEAEPLDISPLVKAINEIDTLDLSAVVNQVKAIAEKPATNTKIIAEKLDLLIKATEKNTGVLSELVDVAKSSKIIIYDEFGRIKEIKVK